MLGEHDDADAGVLGADPVGGLDALHVVAGRHADVGEDGVGCELGDPRRSSAAVPTAARPRPRRSPRAAAARPRARGSGPRRSRPAAAALRRRRGSRSEAARQRRPRPGAESISSVPPSAAIRSAARRGPSARVPPGRSRRRRRRPRSRARRGARRADPDALGARVLERVREALADEEVGGALDGLVEARRAHLRVALDRDTERQARRPALDRLDEAVVGQHGRMDARGELAQVLERLARLGLQVGERVVEPARSRGRAGCGPGRCGRSARRAPAGRRRGCRARSGAARPPARRRSASARPRARRPGPDLVRLRRSSPARRALCIASAACRASVSNSSRSAPACGRARAARTRSRRAARPPCTSARRQRGALAVARRLAVDAASTP